MGHYYSEMVSDKELEEEAKRKRQRIADTRLNLEEAIEQEGVASVLAKMLIEAAERQIWIGDQYRSNGW